MHLFAELTTLLCFLACAAHAVCLHRRAGAWFFGAALLLGLARENFVVLRDLLYGFAPLSLMLGRAPLIGAIIWGLSIYAAVVWAESVAADDAGLFERGDSADSSLSARSPRFASMLLLVGVFMVALAFFYEPFLKLIDMARWQHGTRTFLDVPLIALIGYPTMAWLFLALWHGALRMLPQAAPRAIVLFILIPQLGVAHAAALQWLKDFLHW